jgi:protein gp37
MADTHIQWSGRVWNPTTGCDRTSPGCDHCYALTMAKRLKGMGQAKYQKDGDPRTSGPGFGLTVHEDSLRDPLRWRKPSKVFVNSMSDLFHKDVPDEFLAKVFAVMAVTPQHTYQVLTKRHGRMRALLTASDWTCRVDDAAAELAEDHDLPISHVFPLPNVWLGVSVEDQKRADLRIPALLDTPASVRFISAEPLLGPVDLGLGVDHSRHELDYIDGVPWPQCLDCSTEDTTVDWTVPSGPLIDWVIVGGESGPGARPMEEQWARDLLADCRDAGIAPFVKQMGSVWARDIFIGGKSVSAHGDPKGGDPQYWPADLRVREFPQPVGVAT